MRKVKSAFNSNLVKSLVAFSLSFLTLIISATTFAWLTITEKANTSGIDVSVEDTSQVALVSAYAIKYDGIFGAMVSNLLNENTQIEMSEYDNIFTDRNINTPLILRFEVEIEDIEVNDSITITIKADANYTNNSKTTFTSGDYILNYLSNVISISVGCGLSIDGNSIIDNYNPSIAEEAKIIYDGARKRLEELGNIKSYIDYENKIKSDTIQIIMNRSEYEDYLVNNYLIFYIDFNYNNNLIDDFTKNSLNTNGHIVFNQDIEKISFK